MTDTVGLPGLNFVPADTYVIESLDELRTIANPLRVRILDCLIAAPHTVQEVRKRLGIPSTKLYYHVAELEKAGLIRLVHTEIQAGIQLKYYRAIASYYYLSPNLLHNHNGGQHAGAGGDYLAAHLESGARDLRQAFTSGAITRHSDLFVVSRRVVRMSAEDAVALRRQLEEIDERCRQADDCTETVEMTFLVALFPTRERAEDDTEAPGTRRQQAG